MAYTIVPNLPNLTDRGLAEAFLGGMASAAVDISWARFIPWMAATYDAAMYAPPAAYQSDAEGEDIATESLDETFGSSITVGSFSSAYATSMLARLTMRPDVLPEAFRTLGVLGVRFFATQLYGLLNNATGTTKTFDNVALASASHPSATGLKSNYLNGNLTPDNYAVAIRMLMDQTDHRGNVMGGRPTALHVPTALDRTAKQIVGSDYAAADDRTGINVYKGSARVITAPELTSATRWFVQDENQSTVRVPVVRGPNPWVIDQEQKSGRYEVRDKIFAGFGVIDWRGWVVG